MGSWGSKAVTYIVYKIIFSFKLSKILQFTPYPAGNDTIRLLLHQLLSAVSATSCGDLILPFVISQTDSVQLMTDPVAISLVRLLQKVNAGCEQKRS